MSYFEDDNFWKCLFFFVNKDITIILVYSFEISRRFRFG